MSQQILGIAVFIGQYLQAEKAAINPDQNGVARA